MTVFHVTAVVIDNSLTDAHPVSVEFDHDGYQWDAFDMVNVQYAAQFRGGARIDADRLEVRCCTIMAARDAPDVVPIRPTSDDHRSMETDPRIVRQGRG